MTTLDEPSHHSSTSQPARCSVRSCSMSNKHKASLRDSTSHQSPIQNPISKRPRIEMERAGLTGRRDDSTTPSRPSFRDPFPSPEDLSRLQQRRSRSPKLRVSTFSPMSSKHGVNFRVPALPSRSPGRDPPSKQQCLEMNHARYAGRRGDTPSFAGLRGVSHWDPPTTGRASRPSRRRSRSESPRRLTTTSSSEYQ